VPDLDKRLLMIPPIDLDVVIRLDQSFSGKGGNDVLTVPYYIWSSTIFLRVFLESVPTNFCCEKLR
ncbi:MAG: hypothetical protein Q7J67_08120, partial [bacterium]|nr:hypothetical protein [bacterium]